MFMDGASDKADTDALDGMVILLSERLFSPPSTPFTFNTVISPFVAVAPFRTDSDANFGGGGMDVIFGGESIANDLGGRLNFGLSFPLRSTSSWVVLIFLTATSPLVATARRGAALGRDLMVLAMQKEKRLGEAWGWW